MFPELLQCWGKKYAEKRITKCLTHHQYLNSIKPQKTNISCKLQMPEVFSHDKTF